MKTSLCILALLFAFAAAPVRAADAIEKSQTVVYINGSKFYVHTVQAGQTLYSLAREYGVSEQVILEYNPEAADGLRTDQTLKIPFQAEAPADSRSERKLRRTFDTHTVSQGETLYAISRRYEISVATIIEDNPNLDPAQLRIGEKILIRKRAMGKADEHTSLDELEAYKESLNRVAGEGLAYHVVHPGETVYSLARRFGTTETELCDLNGIRPGELRAGAIIKVPAGDGDGEQEMIVAGDTIEAGGFADDRAEEISFRALSKRDPVRIALLLPLTAKGETNVNYLEFYQGFLLGLRHVKNEYGYSADLTLFNTDRDPQKVAEIVASDPFRDADLIVGPIYEEELPEVLAHAERRSVPVVSPLANLAQANNDALFQLAPSPARKYEKTADLFGGQKKITLISTEHTDKEFEREMLALIGERPYDRHTYTYERGARASNLTQLLENGEDNLLVILAEDEVDVDRILASIASANTNLVSRGRTAPRFTILGNTRWNRYANLDRTMFFKNRIVFLSTYHAKRDSETIKNFDSEYIKAFGALPTLYSYRGYDVAAIFAPGMFADIEYDMEGRRYTPLQTTYVFRQEEGRHNHVNQNWVRVNYNPDFSITLE